MTNGRDVDAPGTAEAWGMFWYFQALPIGGDLVATAKSIYQEAGQPLARVRAAAAHWPQWPAQGVSFNFTKQQPPTGDRPVLQRIGHRDVFHFRAQIDVAAHRDGTGVIRCTATRNHEDVLPLLGAIAQRFHRMAARSGPKRAALSDGRHRVRAAARPAKGLPSQWAGHTHRPRAARPPRSRRRGLLRLAGLRVAPRAPQLGVDTFVRQQLVV